MWVTSCRLMRVLMPHLQGVSSENPLNTRLRQSEKEPAFRKRDRGSRVSCSRNTRPAVTTAKYRFQRTIFFLSSICAWCCVVCVPIPVAPRCIYILQRHREFRHSIRLHSPLSALFSGTLRLRLSDRFADLHMDVNNAVRETAENVIILLTKSSKYKTRNAS